jgi:SAM-dependent MidA family methyltransferase
MNQMSPKDTIQYASAAHAFQKLISEAEMGELFKMIAWSKNLTGSIQFENLCANLPGFTNRQRLLVV